MNQNNTILIVDDERDAREIARTTLKHSGYAVFEATTGRRMLEIFKTASIDLILLDLILTEENALDLIPAIRKQTAIPILILSGRGTDRDKVKALESGADDFITKPFSPQELCARIGANLRRSKKSAYALMPRRAREKIIFGDWVLDRATLQIQPLDKQTALTPLTPREFRILEALVANPNTVLSREKLAQHLLPDSGIGIPCSGRAIDIQITRIRQKLGLHGQNNALITTIRGTGYMLNCKTETLS
ncbi:MAG: response regulator transcription factor [Alphaproteobacteria bacterium]|nr:response regulator transcription factor [Alphaproteobacteria bacterium]